MLAGVLTAPEPGVHVPGARTGKGDATLKQGFYGTQGANFMLTQLHAAFFLLLGCWSLDEAVGGWSF